MHIKRFATLGELHHIFRAMPVLVLGVLLQAFLFQRFQAIVIVGAQQFGTCFHDLVGRPGFRVDDIGTGKSLLHGRHVAERAT